MVKEMRMFRTLRRWLPRIRAAGARVAVISLLALAGGSVQAQEITATDEAGSPELSAVVASDTTTEMAAQPNLTAAAPGDDFDEDPWEGFNEKMFNFNREVLDRFLLKPIATGWDFVFPDLVQRGIRNMFDNLWVVRRVVNNTLQLKLAGAGTELA